MSRSHFFIGAAAVVLAAALSTEIPATAQQGGGAQRPPVSAGPFGALRWRGLGPPRGGRSIAVAGTQARPFEYYMGATGGGLWKTTDGGNSWKAVTDTHIRSSSVGAIGISASNPDVV